MRTLKNFCIVVDRYLLVKVDLSLKTFCNNQIFALSQSCLSEIRQLETLLGELSCAHNYCEPSNNSKSTTKSHVSSSKAHIQRAIDVIHLDSHLEPFECP